MAAFSLDELSIIFTEPMVCLSAHGAVVDLNMRFSRLVGQGREDLIGCSVFDLVAEASEDVSRMLQLWSRSRQALPGALTWRREAGLLFTRCDGARIQGESGALVLLRCRAHHEAVQRFSFLTDKVAALTREILNRRNAEQELRQQRAWLDVVLRSIGDAVIATDVLGRVVFMNPVAEQLTGWKLGDARERPLNQIFEIVNENTRVAVDSPVERVLQHGAIVGLANHTILRRPDGSEIPINDSAAPILQQGRVAGVVLVFRDVTESRRIDNALREREERFRTMADNAPALIWMSGPPGNASWFNHPWREFTGLLDQQQNGDEWDRVIHPDDRQHRTDTWRRASENRTPFRLEYRLRRSDGVYRWMLEHAQPLAEADGEYLGHIGSCIDITDLVEARSALENHRILLEERVRQRTLELEASHDRLRLAERMASLGTLSAGLGHDIGNLLLPMRTRLEKLQTSPSCTDHLPDLAVIAQCMDYLQRLTNGLRLLAQDHQLAARSGETTDLQPWWHDIQPVLRNVLPSQVQLVGELPDEPMHVSVGRAALAQVVFNLAQNAGDVLHTHGGGRILVRIERDSHSPLARLTVEDDGPGMPEDVARRCFDPFFTTKPREFSTGLGLALVHGIVTTTGGRIDLHTELGKGTRFTVWLPLVTGPQAQQAPAESAFVTIKEPRLRAMAIRSLKDSGLAASEWLEREHVPSGRLWVVDEDVGDKRVLEFLGKEESRRVLSTLPREMPEVRERLIHLQGPLKATNLRRQLKAAVQSMSSKLRKSAADE